MADVARVAVPSARLAVLSGPTFAHEVAAGLPTAVTVVSNLFTAGTFTSGSLTGQRVGANTPLLEIGRAHV